MSKLTRRAINERLDAGELVETDQEIRSRLWVCLECDAQYVFDVPERIPAPCQICGGVVFEVRNPVLH